MKKLILFSQNDKNISTINIKLSYLGFEIVSCSPFEMISSGFDNYELAIIDTCGYDVKEGTFLEDILKKLTIQSIPKLVIIENEQKDITSLLKYIGMKVDEIIFCDQLDLELVIRVDFLLMKIGKTKTEKKFISVGDLVLNLEKYELKVMDSIVELTFKEYELLKILLENPNKVFSRTKLLSIVWGYDFFGGSRTVDVHMRRLRTKLEPPYSDMLKTVRNVGYMFSP